MSDVVTLEKDGKIAVVTVNRPEALNALNSEVLTGLKEAGEAALQDEDVLVVIVTGAGEKAFVAGADIKEMTGKTPLQMREFTVLGHHVMSLFAKMEKPTIAAVNGFALGGGCELAIACDIRLASDNAKLGVPEVGLGIFPGFGGTQRLTRLLGKGRACELIFTGKMIGAEDAEKIGLVNKVVPQADLMKEAKALAEEISSKGPLALGLAKSAVNGALEAGLDQGLALERELVSLAFSTQDKEEGLKAFIEKRPPEFKGK
ncbi:MAG: enoyl-CoA hydratase/isomerase family protein [Methanobacteriota archaeon]|nr:MAG: enoyl-CoA hydratase/isomerase family protein [Euryarchaeota archaeon]